MWDVYIYAGLIKASHTGKAIRCGSNYEEWEAEILQMHTITTYVHKDSS